MYDNMVIVSSMSKILLILSGFADPINHHGVGLLLNALVAKQNATVRMV